MVAEPRGSSNAPASLYAPTAAPSPACGRRIAECCTPDCACETPVDAEHCGQIVELRSSSEHRADHPDRCRLSRRHRGGRSLCCARARRSNRRIRELAGGLGYTTELAASLDPADVIDRTLDAVVALPSVDAALIVLGARAATRTTDRAAGLTDDEVERTIFADADPPGSARDRGRLPLPPRRRRRELEAPASGADRRAARATARRSARSLRSAARMPRADARTHRGRARRARAPSRPGDRQRAALHRGARAGRARLTHRAPQPAARSTSSSSREIARAQRYERYRLADRVRPRRFQADQRPHRPSRRRRRARRGRQPHPQRRSRDRHRLPRRRRRVRDDPSGVEPGRRRAARRPHRRSRSVRRRSRRSACSRSPLESQSSARATPRPTSSSAPTKRSTAQRTPAKPARSPH